MKLKVLSLFSGIGAFEKALTNIGIDYELAGFSEIDKYAIKAYCALHDVNKDLNLGDITKIDINKLPSDIDLITHGSPCFLKGELVNTLYGFKNIEEIKVGDIVRSHDGTYNKVIETMINKSAFIYDIKCSASHNINTTNTHPFYVLRDGELQWVESRDLTTNDFMTIPINKKQEEINWDGCELNYNNRTTISNKLPVKDYRFWYLIGRFIGDGWVIKRKDRNYSVSGIKICCGKHELEDLKNKIGNVLKYYVTEDRTTYKLQFVNKELGMFCSRFGMGAKNKMIPQDILDLKNEYLEHLLEGILDSDGSETNGLYKVTSISKELIYNIGELVLKVKKVPYMIYKTVKSKKYVIEGREVNQNNVYDIKFRLNNASQNIHFVDDNYLYSRVRKIDKRIEINDVYNIEVENTHSYCVNNISTHNCQDYSTAGTQKGGDKGSQTRSSLMWNTVTIVKYCKPKYVIWENVKNVLSKKHIHNFEQYLNDLELLGYTNYYKILNAKDYGIPQNRERIFVISILGEHNKYSFPKRSLSQIYLRDMLENKVEEKYNLKSVKDFFIQNSFDMEYKGNGFRFKPHVKQNANIAFTITTRAGGRMDDNYVIDIDSDYDNFEFSIKHLEKYILNEDCHNRFLENLQNLEIRNKLPQGERIKIIGTTKNKNANGTNCRHYVHDINGIIGCLTATDFKQPKQILDILQGKIAIRKLTPRECFRLMGFSDLDIDKIQSTNLSNTQQYKIAGNSIVVDVLEAIFRELFLK